MDSKSRRGMRAASGNQAMNQPAEPRSTLPDTAPAKDAGDQNSSKPGASPAPAAIEQPPVTAEDAASAIAVAPGEPPAEVAAALPEVMPPAAEPDEPETPSPAAAASEITRDSQGMLIETQAAISRELEALGEELAAYTRGHMDALARTAIDALSIKTWSDAVAVNTRLARTSFDQWVDSAAKLSTIAIKLGAEWAKPLLGTMGGVSRPMPPG